MNKSESIVELAKAMSKFQQNVTQPLKDKTNPHFNSNFVSLEGVVQAITETASKYGLSFIQFPINRENEIGVYTLIMHDSGEFIESDPVFLKPVKQDPQAMGSCLTYARRYSLSAVFGITSDEDTDAEVAMGRNGQQSYQQPPQQNYQKSTPTQQSNNAAPQTNSNMISPAQINLIKMKLGIAGDKDNDKMKEIYTNALNNLGMPAELQTKDLNKSQASKMIDYLTNIAPSN